MKKILYILSTLIACQSWAQTRTFFAGYTRPFFEAGFGETVAAPGDITFGNGFTLGTAKYTHMNEKNVFSLSMINSTAILTRDYFIDASNRRIPYNLEEDKTRIMISYNMHRLIGGKEFDDKSFFYTVAGYGFNFFLRKDTYTAPGYTEDKLKAILGGTDQFTGGLERFPVDFSYDFGLGYNHSINNYFAAFVEARVIIGFSGILLPTQIGISYRPIKKR